MARNFFRTAFDRVVEARERQARRYVNSALLSLDDETLSALGHRREEMLKDGATSFRRL